MFQPGDLLMEPRGSLKNSLRIINPTRHPMNDTEKKVCSKAQLFEGRLALTQG